MWRAAVILASSPVIAPTLWTGAAGLADVLYEDAVLTPPEGDAHDHFGRRVAIEGDTAVVSAPEDDDGGDDAGRLCVFQREGSAWTPAQWIGPPAGTVITGFGSRLALSGDTLVSASTFDSGSDIYGAAYVHLCENGVWSRTATLYAEEGSGDDFFARSVAVSGSTIAVGAAQVTGMGTETGVCHVYEMEGGDCARVASLQPSDGTTSDAFGQAVAVDGDVIAVGAPGSGGVYLFRSSGGMWMEEAILDPPEAAAGARFGECVAVHGDRVAVGVWRTNGLSPLAGMVFVFAVEAGEWSHQSTLVAEDADGADQFGRSVAVDGDVIVVGADKDDSQAPGSGSAYVFQVVEGAWTQQAKLLPSTGAAYDAFGEVALSGHTAVVGSAYADHAGVNSGGAFVYTIPGACLADIDGDGQVAIEDVLAVIDHWGPCSGCEADLDEDGSVAIDDLLEVMAQWGACL